jgi:hypothetical protein
MCALTQLQYFVRMHSVINTVTAWFRIFFELLTVIHQVTEFCVGLVLRVSSPWSEKPTAVPYPKPAE